MDQNAEIWRYCATSFFTFSNNRRSFIDWDNQIKRLKRPLWASVRQPYNFINWTKRTIFLYLLKKHCERCSLFKWYIALIHLYHTGNSQGYSLRNCLLGFSLFLTSQIMKIPTGNSKAISVCCKWIYPRKINANKQNGLNWKKVVVGNFRSIL